jgi:hypothetical protein
MRPLLLRQRETSLLCEVVLVCRTEVLPTISDGGAPPTRPSDSVLGPQAARTRSGKKSVRRRMVAYSDD